MNSDRNDRDNANWNPYSSNPGNLYGMRGSEYSEYRPGYSTANDFSGQEPARGRLYRPERDADYGTYAQRRSQRYTGMNRRSQYPETYRSAMSGYMSEHVGDDLGRRDYNQNPNEGNLYGQRYGSKQGGNPDHYRQPRNVGYVSEEDYDRGSPLYGEHMGYGRSSGNARQEQGLYKGKGPRNYRRSDDRIQDNINERLTDDPLVDASEVEVAVQDGEVILSGTVDDRVAKRRAEDIAESVSGVTNVENRIRVRLTANTNPPSIVTPY